MFFDIICLSHLRWNFVFQRPQHLLTRWARGHHRVFFVEEPHLAEGAPRMVEQVSPEGVHVEVPHLPAELLHGPGRTRVLRTLVNEMLLRNGVHDFVLWYYTPMAVSFTRHLKPASVVYDCMDELSAFAFAPEGLLEREQELFRIADLVFTGGHSLYEAKKECHERVYAFPSSIDRAHFARARTAIPDPSDQASIPRPRVGYFGVIDERMDLGLLEGVARLRPDWQFVMLGPVVKIAPEVLPRADNLHYLGGKPYAELPDYVAGWDVAMMPFARNESTRFISPTKTPEYLAAGRPVVTTPIRDVVRPYCELGLARAAETPEAFAVAIEQAMAEDADDRIRRVDAFLADKSWDETWQQMSRLVRGCVADRIPARRVGASSRSSVAMGAWPRQQRARGASCSIS